MIFQAAFKIQERTIMVFILAFSFVGICCGNFLKAQKLSSFYIEPGLSWKRHSPERFSPPDFNLPYLQVKAMKSIYPDQFFVSSAALTVGYRFKNSDKIQLGIMYDDFIQGFSYSCFEKIQTNSNFISPSHGSYYSGVLFTNISMVYKRSVLYIKSSTFNYDRFIRVHLIAGINYCHKPNNGLDLMDTYDKQFVAPDSSVYTLYAETYAAPQKFWHSLKVNVGADITFGKGEREWFTLNINFSFGGQNYYQSYTSLRVEVSKNNNTTRYSQVYKGTGNGIYASITRRFFLKQNRKKKQSVNSEMDYIQK